MKTSLFSSAGPSSVALRSGLRLLNWLIVIGSFALKECCGQLRNVGYEINNMAGGKVMHSIFCFNTNVFAKCNEARKLLRLYVKNLYTPFEESKSYKGASRRG